MVQGDLSLHAAPSEGFSLSLMLKDMIARTKYQRAMKKDAMIIIRYTYAIGSSRAGDVCLISFGQNDTVETTIIAKKITQIILDRKSSNLFPAFGKTFFRAPTPMYLPVRAPT